MTTPNPELQSGRRRALRALLRNPLLSAGGETAEEYLLVRRHSEWLKQWLTTFPAWSLHIDREVARLRKIPADVVDETRPAIDRGSGTPFTRRRYALLCLALATLEKLDEQTTLGQVAQTIMELVAGDRDLYAAGLVFDIGNYDTRRDLVHAVRLLVDTGVLRRRNGDEQQFLNRDDSFDTFYDINRHILAAMLHGSRSASAIDAAAQGSIRNSLADRAERLGDHPLPAGEDARLQRIRSRLVRSLLDDPILYFRDLNDEERKYLERHRGYLVRQICEATGLIAEVRGEGIAMVDDTGDLMDLKLPEDGAAGRMSLILVQWCAGYLKSGAEAAVPVSEVEEHIRDVIRIQGSEWNEEVGEGGAETRFAAETDDALARLLALRLIRSTPEGVVPMAACCRYAAAGGVSPDEGKGGVTLAMQAQTLSLPCPRRERWQPLRSGFVNLYKYDREEFHYENGRLLLRGNNGTGKSRVLALQLPFLLDGEVDPERLEPDADPSKKIEWNLLMGRYTDRTGYTWIEFGRVEEGGKEHYLTIGCGLNAVEGRVGVRQWFFITSQRIGKDLELVSDAKQVLGKERLRGKIGSAGQVFETAGEYRRAVNESLFRLDEYRYANLLDLLIQLRRPQLTRRLDEHELSRALSESLPPVSPAIIASLAEAFRDLQSGRNRLDSSKAALAAVDQFLKGYRRYAEIAAKRRADRVLAAHDEHEASMKEILAAEAQCDRFLAKLARLKTELQKLSIEDHALHAEIAAFQQTPYMKDAAALEQAHREAAEKRKDAESAAAELADASGVRKSCTEEHLRLRSILEQRQLGLAALSEAAAQVAMTAGLEDVHRECFGPLDLQSAEASVLKQARENITSAIQTQIEKVEHVRGLNERVEFAKIEFQRARAERDQLSGLLDDARERLTAARADHQTSITLFLGALSDWTADLTELPLPFDESFLKSVAEWCDRPQGPNPFAAASGKAVEELNVNLSQTRAYLKQLDQTLTSELDELEADHTALTSAISGGSVDESQIRRFPDLQAAILEVQGRLDPVIDSISELDRREGILRGEAHAAPCDEGVRTAYEYSVAVSRHVDSLRIRMSEAEESVSQKQSRSDEIVESRNRAVEDLCIARWVDDLDVLQDGIVRYTFALSALWPALEYLREAQTSTEWAWASVEQATARENRQKEIAQHFERRAVAAEIGRDTAVKAADGRLGEILERIDRARERLEALRVEEKEKRRRYHDTEVAVTRVDERLRSRTAVLNAETDRRDSAAASLRTFASTGLLQLAAPGIVVGDARTWSTTRTVEVAFELASRWDSRDADDSAWDYHQKAVPAEFTTLIQALSAESCESSAAFRDDVFVATAFFAGEERAMEEMRRILFDDMTDRQMLLDARAREILENHLIGKVSNHLRELLHAAEEQVRQMNIELESRPMSTGLKLRFVWRPAEVAPSGLAEARRRLMEFNDGWSSAERQMLGGFLQQQIEAVLSDIEGASWQESLAEALDYRKWHWFGVERYQDGVWKRLTHRTFGTGSGGEKAVALTLPHFAAAAAFYRSADPLAPRLILLDEAFVGIDSDMRAKCMGLIHTFDLDFVMTSEREWGCYQTLPGVAIYQLSTRPDIDAIGLTRWVWNGRQRSLLRNVKSTEVDIVNIESNESANEISEGTDLIMVESPQP